MRLAFARPAGVPHPLVLLLRHELRLLWRGSMFGGRHGWVLALGLTIFLHAIGFGMAQGFTHMHLQLTDRMLAAMLALLFVGGLMMSQAVQRASELLDDKTDLGWLLSTPVPARHILAVRLLGTAGSVSLYWLLMLVPLANGMLMLGRADLIGIYPMLVVLALLVTSAGFLATFTLLRLFGVRHTKALANALASLVGATAFLGSQTRNVLTPEANAAFWQSFAPTPYEAVNGWVWMPARALRGALPDIAGMLCLAMLVLLLTVLALQRWFAEGAQAVVAGALDDAGAVTLARRRFPGAPARALLDKELRLLRRYPGLVGLAGFYLIYLVPAAAAIWRETHHFHMVGDARLLGAAPVLSAGELARLFISVTMMGDQASELTATAPVARTPKIFAKLAAATIGVLAIAGMPLLAIGTSFPDAVPAMMAGVAGNMGCNLLLGLWRPAPIRRTDLRRHRKGWGGLVNLVGLFFSGAWSVAAFEMLRGSLLALIPACLTLLVLLLCRPPRGEEMAYRVQIA